MPELPEVETIRLQLQPKIIGKVIKDVEILEKKQFIGRKQDVISRKIIDVIRYGKVLVFKLVNSLTQKPGNIKYLNTHLKLTGQILYTENLKNPVFKNIIPFTNTIKMPSKTTRIIFAFSDGSGLFFNDMRKFGWVKVSEKPERPKGIDVLSPDFTLGYFTDLTDSTDKPIKILLMDQDKMAGIGNIYANEALFLAKIHPLRKSGSLSKPETTKLYQAIKKVIEQGIKYGGSSGADEAFIKPDSSKGTYQKQFKVYQREDESCPICKTPIKRIKQGGRSSFYCPNCQK
jgi:formamidopyrimidine-DNA glycosylase